MVMEPDSMMGEQRAGLPSSQAVDEAIVAFSHVMCPWADLSRMIRALRKAQHEATVAQLPVKP